MEIQIKALNGKLFTMNVQADDTIKTLKKKIEQKEGISFDEQELVFEGAHLDDSKTLKDYHIQDNFTVDIVVNIKGG
jgi:large subunit ribosomal protein L40e